MLCLEEQFSLENITLSSLISSKNTMRKVYCYLSQIALRVFIIFCVQPVFSPQAHKYRNKNNYETFDSFLDHLHLLSNVNFVIEKTYSEKTYNHTLKSLMCLLHMIEYSSIYKWYWINYMFYISTIVDTNININMHGPSTYWPILWGLRSTIMVYICRLQLSYFIQNLTAVLCPIHH